MDGGSFAICYHAWWRPTLLFLFEEGIHVWNNNTPSRNTIVIFYLSVWKDEIEKKKIYIKKTQWRMNTRSSFLSFLLLFFNSAVAASRAPFLSENLRGGLN